MTTIVKGRLPRLERAKLKEMQEGADAVQSYNGDVGEDERRNTSDRCRKMCLKNLFTYLRPITSNSHPKQQTLSVLRKVQNLTLKMNSGKAHGNEASKNFGGLSPSG